MPVFSGSPKRLAPPYPLKLDTHGFESPIFQGAARTLEQTAIVVVETYNFVLCEGCLRFHEICGLLEEKGFRPIGVCNPLFRPKDGVLWQMDLIFTRVDHVGLVSNTYA